MKMLFFTICLMISTLNFSQTTDYKATTSVASIVPGGLGRSRIIASGEDANAEDFTTTRTDGTKSDQSSIKRKDAKIDNFDETKLLNFYSLTGINFQNIASNDAIITDKIKNGGCRLVVSICCKRRRE